MAKTKKKINIARVIYDAYPHSDLLPIDPEKDCRNLKTLLVKVTGENIGDSLFRFIVVEAVEGGEGTRKGAISVLERARTDLESVLLALGGKPSVYTRSWCCPCCGYSVKCSYEDLAVSGTPICPDCDFEMRLE